MSRSKHKIHIYWLQFVIAAIWVGVIEVALYGKLHPETRRFVIDVSIVLTGILAFEPFGRHIFKYFLVSVGASVLIQLLRKVGHWYMSAGVGFWRLGGPIVALAVITLLLSIIGSVTNKDKLRF